MPCPRPQFNQINLVVADVEASVRFYRALGLDVDFQPGDFHVNIRGPGGLRLELDTIDFARQWDSAAGVPGGSTVLGFDLPSREAVDERHAALIRAGYADHQPPYDAFWGARYAMVEDPDGNRVGLMSPIDSDRKFWPPGELPRGRDR